MTWRALGLIPASLLAVACASQAPEPAPAPETTTPRPRPTAEPTAAAAPAPTSRQIMQRDCQALAQKYGDLVRAEEGDKLNPKLSAQQRATAHANIDKAAHTLSDRFQEGCVASLVGGFAEEAALRCAMASKSLAAFDVCMNGPSEPPPAP